ncbi:toll-like receptor 13 [Saccostrea echinata]|uniref:toll-like receptor 13 n=1 Tax=Saccostrea echinata TaxID=191078 RepID=UPI002A7F6F86|nr:toll-like receptor 13 [Saccostrea echinata]
MTVGTSAKYKWNHGSFCPETPCVCWNPETADCTYRNLRSIFFDLPSSIKTLILTGNKFSSVLDDTFINLINLNITRISMDHCRVNSISRRAFEYFEHLIFLDLSYNSLTFDDLETAMCSLNRSHLQILNISGNDLFVNPGFPTLGFFKCVWLRELTEVVMTEGTMEMPDFRLFSSLKKLEILDLRKNEISYIKQYNLTKLKNLNLADNKIQDLPFFLFSNLKVLNMTKNKLSVIDKLRENVSLPKLEYLNLSDNPITRIQSSSFDRLKNLKSLIIDHIKETIVDSYTFASDSLEILSIGNIAYFPTSIFSNCLKLQSLTILNTEFSDKNFTEFILPLKRLHTLRISHSKIKFIPTLQNFSRLLHLDLSQNSLKNIQSSVFDDLKSIRSIVLHHNLILSIDYISFPSFVWKNKAISLDLSSNPFDCGCQVIWFVKWLRNNKERAENFPDSYKCVSPSDKHGLLANFDASDCYRPNQYLILSFTICGCLSIMCFTAIILRKLRWDIKYYIHIYKTRKPSRYKRILDDEFLYDGFVAYNTSDRQRIMSELIENLEKKYNFKLCLQERDILPGGIFVDDIHHSIEASRKFILVLSNNFMSDQWCRYEALIANLTVVDGRSEKVLIVLLGEISSQYMTNSMKTLMKSTVNLEWTEKASGKKLFWTRIQIEMHK